MAQPLGTLVPMHETIMRGTLLVRVGQGMAASPEISETEHQDTVQHIPKSAGRQAGGREAFRGTACGCMSRGSAVLVAGEGVHRSDRSSRCLCRFERVL